MIWSRPAWEITLLTWDSSLDIALARQAIQRHQVLRLEARARASVVLILHPGPDDIKLLLIRRAQREGDPWSGHMALPGGHRHEQDADDHDTALRETREEIGLDLVEFGEYLGMLDDIRASARGYLLDLVITPFVYLVGASPELVPSEEVAEVVWVSLSALASGSLFMCHSVRLADRSAVLPAWRVGCQVLWGLTYRIVTGFLRQVLGETICVTQEVPYGPAIGGLCDE